jgi:hypothetical protein
MKRSNDLGDLSHLMNKRQPNGLEVKISLKLDIAELANHSSKEKLEAVFAGIAAVMTAADCAEKGGTRSPEDPGSCCHCFTGEGGPDTVEN